MLFLCSRTTICAAQPVINRWSDSKTFISEIYLKLSNNLKLYNLLRFINYHKYFEQVQHKNCLTPWRRISLENFIVSRLYMRSEGKLLCSHQSVTG